MMKEYSHEYADNWYHTPTPIEKAGGLWPIRVGRNLAKSNYKVGPRFITYYSLHFVFNGEGTFTQEGKSTSIQKGDLFCLYPNQTHQYLTTPNQPLEMLWLAFDGRQSLALLNSVGITPDTPYVKQLMNTKIKTLLTELPEKFTESIEEELARLSLIYQLFHELSILAKGRNLVQQNHATSWVQKSVEYMNIHYSEGVSVEDVAQYVGIHRSHFSSIFVEHMGVSPLKYLQSLKMKRAAQMLEEHSYSIQEVALSLGFADLYSFSRAFKNYYGKSPSQFNK